jgi:AcrR family transcriptional regulator
MRPCDARLDNMTDRIYDLVSQMEQAKRECILVEAARAFARFGFKKASIDEIAQKAGVAKGTVYLAAQSKEDLYYQVLNREIRAWVADAARGIDPRKPAGELLAQLSQASFAYLESRPLLQDLLFGRTFELLPAWVDRLQELRVLGNTNVVEVLRLGIRQGRFRPEIDVETVASLLGDLQLTGYVLYGRKRSLSDEVLVRRMQAGLDLVLHGLLATPTATAH